MLSHLLVCSGVRNCDIDGNLYNIAGTSLLPMHCDHPANNGRERCLLSPHLIHYLLLLYHRLEKKYIICKLMALLSRTGWINLFVYELLNGSTCPSNAICFFVGFIGFFDRATSIAKLGYVRPFVTLCLCLLVVRPQ